MGQVLDNKQAINQFLAGVEKRAYHMAYIATSRHDEALDIVQDAMYTLAKNYMDKSHDDWPALFHRILQNKIKDWYRKQSVLNKVFFWRKNTDASDDDYEAEAINNNQPQPDRVLDSAQTGTEIDRALHELPLRQQQTFLLRAWEGLSVKQTADVMQISEGSVKTHYARALESLRNALKAFNTGTGHE